MNLLGAANPSGSTLGVDDVLPHLGESGGVPPWDLTDAIDSANATKAVGLVRRMTGGGGRHPLQVMVTLQNHFERMLRLDGAGVRSDKDTAALLGMKAPPIRRRRRCNRARSWAPNGSTVPRSCLRRPTWSCAAPPGHRQRRCWNYW
ncbi:MAG: hypothetical protein R2789_06585 [Microthrixaceae bacterium]